MTGASGISRPGRPFPEARGPICPHTATPGHQPRSPLRASYASEFPSPTAVLLDGAGALEAAGTPLTLPRLGPLCEVTRGL